MTAPETFHFADDGAIPNSPLPLLLYRGALAGRVDAEAFEALFAGHGWGGLWRNGIYGFHHFHSTAHEVLGIAAGRVRVRFGGPNGQPVEVQAGDAVVIPADAVHATYNDTDAPAKILAVLSPAVEGDGYAAVDVSDAEPWSRLRP